MMATTKSDLVRDALSKLAVIGYDYDIDPEELRVGLIGLETMIASWDAMGIKFPYNFAPYAEQAQGEEEAGIPDIARKAIVYSLAIDLSDGYGKQVTPSVAAGASVGMTALLNAIQFVPQVRYPTRMPRGSGNMRCSRYDRFYRPQPVIDADNAGPLTAEGDGVFEQ